MLKRLGTSLAVIGGVLGVIFIPYYGIVKNCPPETYAHMNTFVIWICGLFVLAMLWVCFMVLYWVISFLYNWIRWIITGHWGKHDPTEITNMDYNK